MSFNGILNLCKPPDRTSFEVVRHVKRLLHQKKVGHGGTLDPLASGVLPICLGKSTRISEFLADSSKTYRAEITFGISTDTYDAEGNVTNEQDATKLNKQEVEKALNRFRGIISQEPPMYSALKHEGKRLYELARQGIVVKRKMREAVIHSMVMITWDPPKTTLDIDCGRGTYVRSLAHDLGEVLGTGAHLSGLIRLRNGPFDIEDAISPSQFETAVNTDCWQELVYPTDFAITAMPAAILDQRAERAAMSGQPIPIAYSDYKHIDTINSDPPENSQISGKPILCRAYSVDGRFLAVISAPTRKGPWTPKRVFVSES